MTETSKVQGRCPCPICKTPDQEVRASVKGKPYIMCDNCDCQIFARSSASTRAMLALIVKPAETTTVTLPQPKEFKPAPSSAPKPEPKVEKPAPTAAKPAARGGIFFGKQRA